MIWNHLLHILFGFLGHDLLTLSKGGVLICLAITVAVQGVDTIRFYSYSKNRLITEIPNSIHDGRLEAMKKDALYKLSQLWLFKIVWYGGVSMFVAYLVR
jgi:hypothetical protein